MDHNHHVDREQAKTKKGQLRFKQQYSKGAGHYVVKPIKVEKEHSYRGELLKGVVDRCQQGRPVSMYSQNCCILKIAVRTTSMPE